tara:strand:+ start:73 stop:462 length:390 start_codon:yes stop_codon:yes gene_type:complete
MKQIFTFLAAVLLTASTFAQTGIGTTTPHASAQLEVSSTTKGFLPPRMTQEARNLITAPVAGLVVWCTDCATEGELQVYNGTAWIKSGVAPGTAQGQMRYWDGTAWLVIAPGTEGQVLTFINGIPKWND